MRIPPVTDALLQRLTSATRWFWVQSMKQIHDRPDNPFGMELLRFGSALAVATPGRPDVHWMNMVEFVDDPALVSDIVAFYRKQSLAPTLSTLATADVYGVARALTGEGFVPSRTLAVLYGRAVSPLPGPTDVVVRRLVPGEIGVFATTLTDGYEYTGELREWALGDMVAWPSREGVTLYLAEVGGKPSGAAVLGVRDGIGVLVNAATVPAYRRRGAHGAMLETRIADAAAAGCELMCSLAEFGSVSQNNMERIGLRLAGTITQWRSR